MTATETLNDGLKRGYELVIGADVITGKVDAAVKEVAPQMRMPGFRPGKVPANLIRRMHGEALHRDAVQEAVSEAVNALLAERGLKPAMQPQVDFDSEPAPGLDVKISLSMEILPEVPATDVDGIELERLVVEPTEADIDSALKRLAESQKSFGDAAKSHKAKTGDLVVMDYAGSVDGKAFEGGTGEGMEVELGSGRLIPGFEDGLVGVKAGDQRDLDVTFPEDYPAAELAGKPAKFAVTVTAVRSPNEVKIDDSLATNLGLENLAKLKDILKDQVEQELNTLTRTYLKRKLLDHLAAQHSFDVPPSMVEAELTQILAQVAQQASEAEQAEIESDRAEYARIAERRVRLGLVLSEIGQANNVQVTQAEMGRLVAREAARFPGQEAQVQKYFTENAMAAAQLRAPLYEEKVVDLLLSKADISERKVDRAELEAAIEDEDETPLGAGHHHHDHSHHHHDHDHDHDHHHDQGDVAAKAPVKKAAKKTPAKTADAAEADAGKVAAETADAPAKKAPGKKAAAAATSAKAAKAEKAAKPAAKAAAAKPAPGKKAPAKKAGDDGSAAKPVARKAPAKKAAKPAAD